MRVEPSVSPAASHMTASPVAQSYTPSEAVEIDWYSLDVTTVLDVCLGYAVSPSANCISILMDVNLLNDTQKIFSHALEDVQDLSS